MSDSAGKPFFSVIMPVYGVEDFLPAAIASVLAQTFDDLELVLVDDASTDGSARIAAAAAEQDRRIRVVHHERNLGLPAARNTGLAEAQGAYVWMVDADDEYEPTALERVHAALSEVPGGADLCLFGLTERYYDEDGKHLYDAPIVPEAGAYAHSREWHGLVAGLERQTLLGYAWNKVYRRNLIEGAGLAFRQVHLIEDILFTCDALAHVESLVLLDEPLYAYRKQAGRSITNSNAYSARTFWELHEARVRSVCDLLDSWDGLDDESLGIMGSLYVRYIVSAIERTYHDDHAWSNAERASWLRGIFASEPYGRLVPRARAQRSPALSAAIAAAKARSAAGLILIGHAANVARRRAQNLFTRTRSER